eukprot:5142243-Pleurochrysis_carterae.AAC.4
MSGAAPQARTVSFYSRVARSMMSSRGCRPDERGRSHRRRHVDDVRVRADGGQQHQNCRHNALGAKAGEHRVVQNPVILGAEVGLLLDTGAQAASVREALGRYSVDEKT